MDLEIIILIEIKSDREKQEKEKKRKKKKKKKKEKKIFSLPLKTMGCFSGRLMSAASDQNLFCGLCSAFNCSFDEFVGEKVVSPSYSSAILAPPSLFLIFWGTFMLFSIVTAPSYILTKNIGEFPFLYTLSSICYLQTFWWWPFWPV